MKIFAQIISVLGIILTGVYSYINNYPFEGITGLLTFLVAFASTFFMSNANAKSMSQNVGDNSKAYQSGRDINIKE